MIRLRGHLALFRYSLKEAVAYRYDVVLTAALRFLPMLGTYLLWRAVYAEAGPPPGRYTFSQIVTYLMLVQGVLIVCGMSGLAHGIAADIRGGALNHALVRPLGWLPALFARRAAEKVAEVGVAALPYAAVGCLLASELALSPDPVAWASFAASLAMSFVFAFALDAVLGLSAFWLLEIAAPLRAAHATIYFLSGHLFPLDLLPAPWDVVVRALPFQYLAGFPAGVLLGTVTGADLAVGLAVQAGWCAAALLAARALFRRGLRRYAAFGG